MIHDLRASAERPFIAGCRPVEWQPERYGLAADTRLDLSRGCVRADELRPGDCLETTAGPQRVLRVLKIAAGLGVADRQVELPAGLLGLDRPMVVAATQKIVVATEVAELYFGADELSMTAAALAEEGLARDLAPAERRPLYLPVVLRTCAVHAGPVALSLMSVGRLPSRMTHDPLISPQIMVSGAELRFIAGLLGRPVPH